MALLDKFPVWITLLTVVIIAISLFFYPKVQQEKEQIIRCGVENCHGLDIICGPNVPDACTALYQLGDFCRDFAKCQIVSGECVFAIDQDFASCKSCVEKCTQQNPVDAFACEQNCRNFFS